MRINCEARSSYREAFEGPMLNTWVMRLARLQPWYLLTRYNNLLARSIFAFVSGFLAIGIMAAAAIWTRQPLIFPSLGSSAYLFFFKPSSAASAPRNTILGHGIGILIGWVSFSLFGRETPVAEVMSVAFSLGLISAVMIRAKVDHPPAASTTLIVSLGLMTEPTQLLALMAAAVALTAQAYAINRLSGVAYPIWSVRPKQGNREFVASALTTDAPAASSDLYAELADRLAAREELH